MNTLNAPRPRRPSPPAFTLIELLVVIAIIALLAGLVVYLLPGITEKKVRGRVKAESAALEAAINSYKSKIGFYPPDNPDPARTDRSLLYYELTATDPDPAVTNYMGATGIANSGDVKRNFHETIKPSAYQAIPGSPNALALLVPYKGTNGDFNVWHYSSSSPQHNLESFDLWAVVVVGDKTITIGNWKE